MNEETEENFDAVIKVFLTFATGVLSGFGGFYVASFIGVVSFNFSLFMAIATASLISSTVIIWASMSHENQYGDSSDSNNQL